MICLDASVKSAPNMMQTTSWVHALTLSLFMLSRKKLPQKNDQWLPSLFKISVSSLFRGGALQSNCSGHIYYKDQQDKNYWYFSSSVVR
eukprot:m.202472 g.202472  ORF g.202472 m.202472 type:complete len:89 (+) comp25983_c0_seq4:180-446(+)